MTGLTPERLAEIERPDTFDLDKYVIRAAQAEGVTATRGFAPILRELIAEINKLRYVRTDLLAEVKRLQELLEERAAITTVRVTQLVGEVDQLRALLDQIAAHHNEQAKLWQNDDENGYGGGPNGDYHRERARVARGQP